MRKGWKRLWNEDGSFCFWFCGLCCGLDFSLLALICLKFVFMINVVVFFRLDFGCFFGVCASGISVVLSLI